VESGFSIRKGVDIIKIQGNGGRTDMRKKILFISGSIGLGHVIRDMAIAREIRASNPEVDIMWLAASPASDVIEEYGEVLLPESEVYCEESSFAEKSSTGYEFNILSYLLKARKGWESNVEVFKRIIQRMEFDLIIADEAYEIAIALKKFKSLKTAPFVMIYDFVGLDAATKNPIEKLGAYYWNFIWVKSNRASGGADLSLFVGEPEDIPDRPLGLFLPNRRSHAVEHYKFLGNILAFNPQDYLNINEMKSKLGYGTEPLMICAVGGTSIGAELLNLCSRAYTLLRERIPDLHMVMVCGPRIDPDSVHTADGIDVKGYLHNLYEHLAACDIAVVQGGGSSTIELASLRRPFIYFPLEGDCEQADVSYKLDRIGAGVKMEFSKTDEAALAEAVLENMGKKVSYPDIPTAGAKKAADLIMRLF
jgi:UDP:flavonoid glycosyltransferase YjiC (YdhE family)